MAGILRGSGRQALGAVINFVAYYVIGLPLGISLAFAAHLGALGMWIGLATANALQVREGGREGGKTKNYHNLMSYSLNISWHLNIITSKLESIHLKLHTKLTQPKLWYVFYILFSDRHVRTS